jgi:hypothetical protein
MYLGNPAFRPDLPAPMLCLVRSSGRRQWIWVSLVAFAVSACVTVVLAATPGLSPPFTTSTVRSASSLGEGASATGSPSSGHTATPRAAERFHIGIAYGDTLPWKSDQDLGEALDDAVDVGAGWIRVDLSWNDIQPDHPDRYEWQRFDRVVEAARQRGLNVLPVIGYTPGWDRDSSCHGGQSCAPLDAALFAAFASDAVKRYAPMGVHTWEIWNEENGTFWLPRPDPAAYTRLLRLATTSMRAADPTSYLLMGGLAAGATDPKKGYVAATEYLTAVSELGGNKLVDGIAYHPYTYPHLLSDQTAYGDAFERISSVDDSIAHVLGRYGTPDLPVWITEVGAPTVGPGVAENGTTITTGTHVTEQRQAEIAADSITAATANSHVDALFWFADQDNGSDPKETWHYYGLRRGDGSLKPAFHALQTAIAAYRGTRSGPMGRGEPVSPSP